MTRTTRLLAGATLVMGIMGALGNDAVAQRVSLQAGLASTGVDAKASGKARFEQRDKRIKFSAEAEDLSVSKSITVYVAGKLIGSVKVNNAGTADLNMSGGSVPEMHDGDSVEIRNQDGKTILRGELEERKRSGPLGGGRK